MKYIDFFDHKVIKTSIATVISIAIAEYFGLKYALTAGIVAIITIQGTVKETYRIASERIIATTIGLIISSLLFYFLGYNYINLGIFILIFMPICIRFKLIQGFLVNVVLATHLINEQSSNFNLFLNEFSILIIGLSIGIIFNFYMPDGNKDIKKISQEIGEIIQKILLDMGDNFRCNCVSTQEQKLFDQLKEKGTMGRNLALNQFNNAIFSNNTLNIDYFRMRYLQYKILKRMRISFGRIYKVTEYSLKIAELVDKIAITKFDEEEIIKIIKKIEDYKLFFKNSELPKTREDFENRAILYGFLTDIEEFSVISLDYLKNYSDRKK
ncbi:MAG: aromatic acid exporter family protein [Fusobacteriaceae bacterium]